MSLRHAEQQPQEGELGGKGGALHTDREGSSSLRAASGREQKAGSYARTASFERCCSPNAQHL